MHGALAIYSYFTLKNSNSGDETDIDSGNESDFEDEAPILKKTRKQIIPGKRLIMLRR